MPQYFDTNDIASVFGEFEEVTYLGDGGMKSAYSARNDALGKVTLKVVHESLSDDPDGDDNEGQQIDLPARIAREVALMAAVDHPNIVELLDGPEVREVAGKQRAWWVEPFYPSGLKDTVGSPWEREATLSLGMGLLAGVDALSGAAIIHRDIKPGNVMYTEEGSPIIIDLGIAYLIGEPDITDSGVLSPRTAGYMAPEQLLPRSSATPLDSRVDLFQVGICLHYASTGIVPFAHRSPDYVANLESGVLDIQLIESADLSDEMVAVVLRLLSRRKSARYRTTGLALEAWEGCQ